MRSVAVVGVSLAGLRAAEALRREGFDGRLYLIGSESHFPPYDRPPLSKQVLTGKWAPDKALLRAGELDAELRLGTTAINTDLVARRVALTDGDTVDFDGLVIATGASPRRLPGTDGIEGVHVLRTLEDCTALRAAFDAGGRLVVIGAGFIGSEVASSARELDVDVTVVEALDFPLERVLGRTLGPAWAELQQKAGVDLRLGVGVDRLEADGAGRIARVHLRDGSTVEAGTVVVGIGVVPNTAWLAGTRVALDDGVVCDDRCRALDHNGAVIDGVVAAGDVARWPNPLFGEAMRVEHWTNASEQGDAAARALLRGEEAAPYAPVPYFWSDQFGAKLQYVGHCTHGDQMQIVEGAVDEGRFVAAWGRAGVTTAALCVNRPNRTIPFRNAIAKQAAFPPDLSV